MIWLLQSRKAQVAMGAILSIVLSRLLPRLGFTTEDVNAIGMAIGAIASVLIGGIAHEDAGKQPLPPIPGAPASPAPPIPSATTTSAPSPAKPAAIMVTLNPASLEAIVATVVKKLQPTQPASPIATPKGA